MNTVGSTIEPALHPSALGMWSSLSLLSAGGISSRYGFFFFHSSFRGIFCHVQKDLLDPFKGHMGYDPKAVQLKPDCTLDSQGLKTLPGTEWNIPRDYKGF